MRGGAGPKGSPEWAGIWQPAMAALLECPVHDAS